MTELSTPFTTHAGVRYPIICGAMFPCSNPELVAAASAAGALGMIQPISFERVHRRPLREAMRDIRRVTANPVGLNVLIERSVKRYEEQMMRWVDIALEEGCRFFITALGNPRWVVDRVRPVQGIVYHNTTERRWAEKALDGGVHGLICVNNRAGGHAGRYSAEQLYEELSPLGMPLICAGGIGDPAAFHAVMNLGYGGVQMGTRFIASTECSAHEDYKQAIISADESDIVLTHRVTGVPLSVIRTPYVKEVGTELGPLTSALLHHPWTKGTARAVLNLWNMRKLGASVSQPHSPKDYYQAGKSVGGIGAVEPVATIVERFMS